jgi:hypothetical protein
VLAIRQIIFYPHFNMSASESSLAAFRHAFFGPLDNYLAWHDGFDSQTDLTCLDALTPTAQDQAAAELLAALRAGTADARAMLGLAHLRYAEALPLLHDYVRRGAYALYALGAIAAINPAGLYPPLVAASLRAKATTEYQLMDVLIGLREYFTLPQLGPAIPPLVFSLVAHGDYLVRYHALETLRRLYGSSNKAELHDPERIKSDEIFGLITKNNYFARFGKAQRLLLAELPAATLARYPLVAR